MTRGALRCALRTPCERFKSTLLVLKINPVRLLWLDFLVRFYATGFQHIAVYAPQRKPVDLSSAAPPGVILVGQYDWPVRLLDDNLGFCDHETVADAMRRYPAFRSFIFLSDDVLFEFWRATAFDQRLVWRQKPTKNTLRPSSKHLAAIAAVAREFPDLAESVLPKDYNSESSNHLLPFAATSGVYHVPANFSSRFMRISSILLAARSYNEFGTPFLLSAVDKNNYVELKGKLAWRAARLLPVKLVRQMERDASLVWLHPVRATGELFSRISHAVLTVAAAGGDLDATAATIVNSSIWANGCFDCASYPSSSSRKMKGLLHSCAATAGPKLCDLKSSRALVSRLWPDMKRLAADVAGRVVVRPERESLPCGFEDSHEGFWSASVYDRVFSSIYPHVNHTRMRSRSWSAEVRECCEMSS